jgi:glutamyl-tRNA synthetase
MFNYLCFLGWSPKSDREIYSREELIEIFDERNFNASNAVFDEEKLVAFNREHLNERSEKELAELAAPMMEAAGLATVDRLKEHWAYYLSVIALLKSRARRVSDFVSLGAYFFSFDYTYEEKAAAKQFTAESAQLLEALAEAWSALESFTEETTETALAELARARGIKNSRLIHPVRLAVSGRSRGPGLYEMLVTLSQPVVVERIEKAVQYIRNR